MRERNNTIAPLKQKNGMGEAISTLATIQKFSIDNQIHLFPPMVNTLYLEKEIENNLLNKQADKIWKKKLKAALNNKNDPNKMQK